ncbi:hypothetical protein ACWGIU_14505 [Streptomyces sp. NPDC054840]
MTDILFTGTAVLLLCFAAYRVRGRGGHRRTGTWAVAALPTSFVLAFVSCAPAVERAVASPAPPAAGTRTGELPAETAWLLLVADAYARRPAPANAGAGAAS